MQPRPPNPQFHPFGIGVTAVQCLVVADEGPLPCKQRELLVSSEPAISWQRSYGPCASVL